MEQRLARLTSVREAITQRATTLARTARVLGSWADAIGVEAAITKDEPEHRIESVSAVDVQQTAYTVASLMEQIATLQVELDLLERR